MIPYCSFVKVKSRLTWPTKGKRPTHTQSQYCQICHTSCTPNAHYMTNSFLSSTRTLAAVPSADLTSQASTTSFDAILPDTTTLIGFGIILIVCAIAANVWANQVVPISRTKLAIAKQKNSNSTLRQYLDELLEIENSTGNSVTTFANMTELASATTSMNDVTDSVVSDQETITDDRIGSNSNRSSGRFEGGNRAWERWLFTDWLVKDSTIRKSGRQKEPAVPILKSAKWNSGDNPVLVATTLILLGVLLTSVTERITSILITG